MFFQLFTLSKGCPEEEGEITMVDESKLSRLFGFAYSVVSGDISRFKTELSNISATHYSLPTIPHIIKSFGFTRKMRFYTVN